MTKRHLEVLKFFHDFPLQNGGLTPSYDEAAKALGFTSRSNICRIVTILEHDGYVRKPTGRARTIEVTRMPVGAQ